MKKSITFVLILSLLMIFANVPTTKQVNGADGTTGSVNVSNDQIYEDTMVTITLKDLTVSGAYKLHFTAGCHANISFTCAATETKKIFTVKISAATSGDICTVALRQQSADTLVDSADIWIRDIDDSLDTTFITNLAVPVIIILILVGIVVRFKK